MDAQLIGELDAKVKVLLERITLLCRIQAVSPLPSRGIEIATLISAIRMIEGKSNG